MMSILLGFVVVFAAMLAQGRNEYVQLMRNHRNRD
jgi:hypothetical protein